MSPEDFSEQYSTFVTPISRFVARRVDRDDVEDVVLTVLEVAWHNHHKVTDGEELPWLYRIASNVIANHRRKVARHARLIASLVVRDPSPSAESIAVADVALAAAWGQLSPTHREVLALTAIDGLTVRDAATVLGVTANAVSVRLTRAREQLAQFLNEQA